MTGRPRAWPTQCSACHTPHVAGRPEWTCALDSIITHRQLCCTLCGTQLKGSPGWVDIREVGPRSIPTVLCLHCRGSDPGRTQLMALLAQRYGLRGATS
jgi:hypothetical protein